MSTSTEIGGYRIVRTLGRGASGLVYLAQQPATERLVALKVLVDGLGKTVDDGHVAEAALLARLEHPAIAAVLESGTVDLGLGPQPFFAMEFVDGRPLDEATDAIAVRDRVELLRDACLAIEHAHRRGVIHRDLKPDNILVLSASADEGPRLKILDFGVAQAADIEVEALTRHSGVEEVAGTLAYMSPDQIQLRSEQLDARVDVYALGALLFRVVSGRAPHDLSGMPLLAALEAISEREPPLLGALEPAARGDLEAIAQTAMAKQREERYATAADLAADLDRWLDGRPVAARPPSPIAQLRRSVARHRVAATAILSVGVALTVAVVFLWAQTRHTNDSIERFESLAISTRVAQARQVADALFPPWPENAGAMRRYVEERALPLQRAIDPLLGHQAVIAAADPAAGTADRFLLQRLNDIIADLVAFTDPSDGELAAVQRRLQWATTIARRSIEDHREKWQEVTARLAESGIDISPQVGLVPLGPDPRSGLQEFAHLASGRVPRREPTTGELQLDGESSIVFVLIPGGSFAIGAQAEDPDAANYDPDALENESSVHSVTLAAFFVAKHELSRGQWQRLVGGDDAKNSKLPMSGVSWYRADRQLRRWGLTLPTEAQWEYAARAGTTTPMWTKGDSSITEQAANLREIPPGSRIPGAGSEGWSDGFDAEAPIDSMLPNPFGLHHTMGNVMEWCSDWHTNYRFADVAPGTGEHRAKSSGEKAARGAQFASVLQDARVSRRHHTEPNFEERTLGMRPARAVIPGDR
ncbi:MAG: bifunctional serine/threonine-protein kinase/formylglycine-generating enzyme family protein [bacterium]|nr:bifunctional serine/threonine-protein kinase/formylglycine-generating enzyme family protein [bacterium]